MTDEALDQLLTQQRILIEKLSKKKDFWDKFASLSTFIGTVLLAAIGLYFTTIYKHQEVRVAEAQTIEKFLPHLTGTNENEKKGAIISIASLDDPTLAARLGVAFSSSGSVDALEFIYKQAKGDDKDAVKQALIEGYQKRGDEAIWQKIDPDIAIKAYSRILELDPKVDNYSSRAVAYVWKQDYDSALKDAKQAIEANSKNCLAYDAMGRSYDGKNDLAQALDNYTKAIQCGEDHTYYIERAWVHFRKDELDLAKYDYDAAIRLDPSDAYGYWKRGTTLAKQGKRGEAISDLRMAIYLDRMAHNERSNQIEKELGALGAKYEEPSEGVSHAPLPK